MSTRPEYRLVFKRCWSRSVNLRVTALTKSSVGWRWLLLLRCWWNIGWVTCHRWRIMSLPRFWGGLRWRCRRGRCRCLRLWLLSRLPWVWRARSRCRLWHTCWLWRVCLLLWVLRNCAVSNCRNNRFLGSVWVFSETCSILSDWNVSFH